MENDSVCVLMLRNFFHSMNITFTAILSYNCSTRRNWMPSLVDEEDYVCLSVILDLRKSKAVKDI